MKTTKRELETILEEMEEAEKRADTAWLERSCSDDYAALSERYLDLKQEAVDAGWDQQS